MFRKSNALAIIVLLVAAAILIQCRGRGTDSGELATGTLVFTGTVTDAASGDPIDSGLVTINGPAHRTTGTDTAGDYDFSQLPAGTYQVTASKGGYIPLTKSITLSDTSSTEPILTFVLTEGLAEGEWRFVLSWGEEPLDVDAHIWSGGSHVYWANRGSEDSDPFIYLDVDDRVSYGPETITVKDLQAMCYYAVHNFSGTPAITTSNAIVDIYNGGALVATYPVPTSGSGDWWYVCDLDTNGSITAQNIIGSTPPSTAPIFRAKPPQE